MSGALRDRFLAGLREAGHEVELAALYAERFDPTFRSSDMAFFADESLPEDELEAGQIREKVLEGAGGPVRRVIARRWMRNKTSREVARMVFGTRSKDVLREQERGTGSELRGRLRRPALTCAAPHPIGGSAHASRIESRPD